MTWVDEIIGLETWGAKTGIGTHLTVELGKKRTTPRNHIRGAWSIWVKAAPWRILAGGALIAGSGNDDLCSEQVEILNNKVLKSLVIENPAYSAVFEFSEDLKLEVFIDSTNCSSELIVMSKGESFFLNGSGNVEHESE